MSYALVFDGWSEASRHFIGVFIVYPGKHGRHNGGAPADPEMHLLAFAPLVDETNFTADISHELHQGNTGMVLHTS